ncbi:hypothetical protein DOJK_00383 [Patescibacteria group bacterium]|nr:hypothetical protein [Candidatus Dojkabacteria bacterium]CAG1020501.1 hypothetical protein DOJK_00383 [Patescibacteria group bacterium]
MTIKKASAKEISIETANESVKVLSEGGIRVEIGSSVVNQPGEYEINNVNIIALEVPTPDYQGKANFVSVSADGIDVGIIFDEKASEKDSLKDIANIDILAVNSEINVESVRKLITYFEPQYLLFFGPKKLDELQKEYNMPNLVEEKSLKVKESDFPRGENIVLRQLLLK